MATPGEKKKLVQDKRFQHVHTDPRFQRAAKSERKFQPDARFQKMFTDKSFNTNYKVDAWGRKIETGQANELLKYYDMDEETKQAVMKKGGKKGAAAAAAKSKPAPKKGKAAAAAAAEDEDEDGEDDEGATDEQGFDGNFMSSRGMAPPSSDEDGEDDDEEDEDAEEDQEEEEEDEDEDVAADDAVSTSDDSDVEMEVATEEEVIPTGDQTSRRLAVMNLEWDRLSSVDLLVLFRSFVPQQAGSLTHPIRSVKVYPSEFGRTRMKEEAMYGPTNIYSGTMTAEQYKNKIQQKISKAKMPIMEDDEEAEEEEEEQEDESERSSEEDEDDSAPKRKRVSFPAGTKTSKKSKQPTPAATPAKPRKSRLSEEEQADKEATDDILSKPALDDDDGADESDSDSASSLPSEDDGNEFDKEKLRAYELERLKYYYAIVECDTASTAEQLYRSCDGLEFEHSSNLIDLRYVPDEVSFAEEEASIRDQCSKVPVNYKAPEFYTQALQHTNVQLTWDRDDPTRTKLLNRKFKPEDEQTEDLKAYLGSDNEEDGYGSDAMTEASDSGSDDGEESAAEDEDEDAAAKKPKKRVVLKRKARSKYLALLQELKAPEEGADEDDNHEVSITFEPGLKAKGEEIARKALNKGNEAEESTWEKHLRERLEKKKAKKKARKEKLKGLDGKDASAATGGDEDSGDEIGGAGAKKESDLYEDDAVEYDANDDFFKLSDDDEFEAPKSKKAVKKSAIESDDDEDAIEMSSESGEERSDYEEADDEDDIDALHGKAKAKRFFDDSTPMPKKKATAAAAAAEKKKPADKKRKRGDDESDSAVDRAQSDKEKAELELLLMDNEDTNESGARGYSLQTLLKQKKAATLADAGGKRSKKAKRDAANAAAQSDDFQVDTKDTRFGALFSNSAFSIDPTHPSFKQTEGTDQLLHEKARRRQEQEKEQAKELARRKEAAKKGGKATTTQNEAAAATTDAPQSATSAASLASLVASVKRKANAVAAQAKKPAVAPVGKNTAPASKRSKPDVNL